MPSKAKELKLAIMLEWVWGKKKKKKKKKRGGGYQTEFPNMAVEGKYDTNMARPNKDD